MSIINNVNFLIDLKTRTVAPFFPEARTFHNIHRLQKHVLLRHQSYLIVFTILADNAPLTIKIFIDESSASYKLFSNHPLTPELSSQMTHSV